MAMNSWEGQERRSAPELRAIFEQAYGLIEPFLDPNNAWAGQSMQHLALRTLCDSFPQLSLDQAHILVVAATRVFKERN